MTARETQREIYTVTRLTREIKGCLEKKFPEIWLEGEISNFKQYPSGHLYFSLKDEGSIISCVLFKNSALKLAFAAEDGMKVLSRGKIGVYDKRGQYQFYVSFLEPSGKGALQLAFEQLKEKLRKEGLFDEHRKRALPALPFRVGVVTSSSGAAIEDILNVARRRFANVEITLRPVRVQGDGSKEEIRDAINEFNEYNEAVRKKEIKGREIDVLIVGRGGGSLEDLWAFNEEEVARAIYSSKIPVISAVGHEVDFTIADFTADLRASTPSAAAELVMPRKADLEQAIETMISRMTSALKAKIDMLEKTVQGLSSRYVMKDPANMLVQKEQEVDDLLKDLEDGMKRRAETSAMNLAVLAGKMKTLNPLAVLERGYSITFKDGKPLREASSLSGGDRIRTKLAMGEVESRVEKIFRQIEAEE
ncbi:MAG: exodeoxyribonuclease VII large subunit [Candidatus Omnitrophota bacterium]